MKALSKITVKNDIYEIKDSAAHTAIADEITRATAAEKALSERIDNIPTGGGGGVATNSLFINFNEEYPDVTSCTKQDVINRIINDGRIVKGMVVVYNDSQTFFRTIIQYIGNSTSPSLASTSSYWVNVGDKYSEWESDFSLNNYIDKGVYHFRGVRNPDEDEGFPTDWDGAFGARLEVINGYNGICSQTLTLTEQGKTALYTRTRIADAWSDWEELGGYTLPVATTDTLGGVKSQAREGECYSDVEKVQYGVVVHSSGFAHVTLPYADSSKDGVVRLEHTVNNNYKAVSGKAVVEYVANAVDTPVVNQTATTATIAPNVLNVWGEVATLDITLGEPKEGVVNEYMFQFTSGATATTLALPADIKWVSAPNIQANKTYQVSIINNLGVIGEFGNE